MAQISLRHLAQFCRRMATSLEAGLDVRRVCQTESERGAPHQRQSMSEVSRRVAGGDPLADAMIDSGGYFPPLACEMVRVGEQTGRLESVFHQLADHYDHLLELRRTFLAGVAWPLIELALAIGVMALFIMITAMLDIDPLGLGIKGIPLLVLYLFLVALAAAAVVVPLVALKKGWLGTAPLLVAMRIPVVGSCLQLMALSRMAWSLGMAIDAGMDARRSIRLALRSTQNPYYASHAEPADSTVLAGGEMHEALRKAGEYPADFLDTLETGEMTGQVTETMSRLSAEYRRRAEATLRILAMIGGVLVFLAVAAMIGGLIIYMFMQYVNTINSLSNGF